MCNYLLAIMNNPIIKRLGLFFIISFCVLFLLSPDSYTHDLYDRIDTGWFFTCGKAWMNGMIPYVDFADSKGPLLWLIYGVGYLLSPHNYIGMFWISVFLYTAIFYLVYKTANIFLNKSDDSIIIAIMMITSFFCRWYHYEIRAEDFNLLFVSLLFYRFCLLLYTEEGKNNKNVNKTCFIFGLSIAATLLIKYNATAMIGLVGFYLIYAIIREKRNLLFSILFAFVGFVSIIIPFFVYMLLIGNFNAFIQEYFLNTIKTIDSFNNTNSYLKEWLFLTYDTLFVILFFISLLGSILMSRMVKKYNYFFLISFLCFYAISIHHSSSYRIQYMDICLYFPIWLCIAIIKYARLYFDNYKKKISYVTSFLVIYTFISNMFNQGYLCQSLFFNNNDGRKYFYETAYFLSQVEKPTIIYFGDLERGISTPAEALPGSKYWSLQMHATKEMINTQQHDALKGTSDFILTSDYDSSLSMKTRDSLLTAAGYHEVYRKYYGTSTHYLYTKHHLKTLPDNFYISNLDVLFKINPLKNYD